MVSVKVFTLLVTVCCFMFLLVASTEFEVGDKDGWAVPDSKRDADLYNDWASHNRFKVNDTVRFKYKKDAVMVVTEEEYKKCRSSRPEFFSNNGDTVFKLNRSGLFYFISGVSGHCQKGQKMIIKVLEIEPPSQSQDQTTDSPPKKSIAAASMCGFGYNTGFLVTFLVLSVYRLV